MSAWSEVEQAAGELAADVRRGFDDASMALLATLRRDGSPRISGIEVSFKLGELWLGMMPSSRKGQDLDRDGRLALHAAPGDQSVGDAKLTGTAHRATEAEIAAFVEPGQPTPFDLFRVDVRDISTLRVAGDHLVIKSWREGGEVRSLDRY